MPSTDKQCSCGNVWLRKECVWPGSLAFPVPGSVRPAGPPVLAGAAVAVPGTGQEALLGLLSAGPRRGRPGAATVALV